METVRNNNRMIAAQNDENLGGPGENNIKLAYFGGHACLTTPAGLTLTLILGEIHRGEVGTGTFMTFRFVSGCGVVNSRTF